MLILSPDALAKTSREQNGKARAFVHFAEVMTDIMPLYQFNMVHAVAAVPDGAGTVLESSTMVQVSPSPPPFPPHGVVPSEPPVVGVGGV